MHGIKKDMKGNEKSFYKHVNKMRREKKRLICYQTGKERN